MKSSTMFRVGVALLALGIAAGAFGAHGLKDKVTPDKLETFEIGVRYHFYNAIALMAAAAWFSREPQGVRGISAAIIAVMVGTAIFSGTLYGIALGGPRWLGAITPIGGTLQIIGWAVVSVKAGSLQND